MSKPKPTNDFQLALMSDAAVTFDLNAFEDAIKYHGVTLEHWMGMVCPIGLVDNNNYHKIHEDHDRCSNGFIFTYAGEVNAVLYYNKRDFKIREIGNLEDSSIWATFSITYENGKTFKPTPFDRFYVKESNITVVHWQTFKVHETGYDRLRFPIEEVVDLMDNTGHVYSPADYTIEDKKLKWIGQRPFPETVCSIRYLYRPYYYLESLPHELRIQQINTESGRVIQPFPMQGVLQREYVYQKDNQNPEIPDNPRAIQAPKQNNFGPR